MKEFKSLMDMVQENKGIYEIDLADPQVHEYLLKEGLCECKDEDILGMFFHYRDAEIQSSCHEDMSATSARYFGDSRICYSCGGSGHIESSCPTRNNNVCILCASVDHEKYNCPQMVCSKCNMCGHRFRDCREDNDRRRFICCNRCPYEHPVSDCPAVWRHYKTNGRRPIRPANVCCSMCYGNDHFIDDCGGGRAKYSIFTNNFTFFLRNGGSKIRRSR